MITNRTPITYATTSGTGYPICEDTNTISLAKPKPTRNTNPTINTTKKDLPPDIRNFFICTLVILIA